MDKSIHPTLQDPECKIGCRLDLGMWTDTICSVKHDFVEEFIEGQTVIETGFTSYLGTIKDLPIDNVFYVYDTTYGT